ncbi:MAG: hypothetical protein RIK87_00390 [Fuerstiella sp.]
MRPKSSTQRWFAAAVCLLATSGPVSAEEGVFRISDAGSRPGVVQMGSQPKIQPTSYIMPAAFNNYGYADYAAPVFPQTGGPQAMNPYQAAAFAGFQNGPQALPQQHPAFAQVAWQGSACGAAGCPTGSCGPMGCPDCYGESAYCPAECSNCYVSGSSCPSCDSCFYGPGHQDRVLTLFAKATPPGSCNGGRWPKRWIRGQQLNYLARNQRLSNTLFGWLVPSGCSGQGCPPFGKYQITYADQPDYAHPQDGMAYGAQGYGVPVSVPLAPTVRQSYNYSWGTPASRITPQGNFDPQTSVQPLYRQCW